MDTTQQQLLALGKKLLAELRALNANLQEQIKAINEANDSAQHAQETSPEISAVLNLAERVQRQKEAAGARQQQYEKRTLIISWLALIVTTLTLFALIAYSIITYRIYQATDKSSNAAKESADNAAKTFNITNKITESNNQAVLDVRASPSIGQNRETIQIVNTGRVNAEHVFCHLEVARKSLPSLKMLALIGTIDIAEPEIIFSKSADRTLEISLSDRDRQHIISRAETIVTSGTMNAPCVGA